MAATGATPTVKQVDKVQLRVMINRPSNQVVYAEAGKDFVDVLLSFLTLPLGTIVKLVAQESNIEAVRVGSLSSLYQSVADIDKQYLSTPACKEMLLNPRNSMAEYCRKLKLNIDETEPMQYFRCPDLVCNRKDNGSLLSTFRNQECTCGKLMYKEVFPECLNVENGFVEETTTFIISDDLHVMPNVFGTTIRLLQKLGVDNNNAIQEQTVDITKKEVIDLLKLSFLSNTCLTDFIFKKKKFLSKSSERIQSEFEVGNVESSFDGTQMDLKVMVRKSNGVVVFAEAEENFADILFSFLAFPLGGVLHMLEGFTLGCFHNLYLSMIELSPDRYLISQDLKDKLAKSKTAPQFDLTNQIIPIGATPLPVYYCHTYYINHKGYYETYHVNLTKEVVFQNYSGDKCVQFNFIDPKTSSNSPGFGGFAKGPSTYMVTDDLAVNPMSSASAMSYLNRSEVPLNDLDEKVLKIGVKEFLAILKASLISASALTVGLSQYLTTTDVSAKRRRTIKNEK